MHLLRHLTGRLLQSGTIIRPDSPDWSSLQYTETMLISERTAEKVTQLKIIFMREKFSIYRLFSGAGLTLKGEEVAFIKVDLTFSVVKSEVQVT